MSEAEAVEQAAAMGELKNNHLTWHETLPCKDATECLAKAIVQMQIYRNVLNGDSSIYAHTEWLTVKDNRVAIHVNVTPANHFELLKVEMGVGVLK